MGVGGLSCEITRSTHRQSQGHLLASFSALSCSLVSHHLLFVSCFHQHTDLTLSYLVTIWAVLVSCSYFTQSTFCCNPLCCVLKTILLLVASLWKIHFFHCEMPDATKWSSLLHSYMLPYLALRPHCPEHGDTKPRCKPPSTAAAFLAAKRPILHASSSSHDICKLPRACNHVACTFK